MRGKKKKETYIKSHSWNILLSINSNYIQQYNTMSSILAKSTLFAAIGRSTASKAIYVPAASLHLSSVIYRETVVDKAKHVADTVNKKVGEKLGDAIEGAEHVTNAASHKTEELKRQATHKSEDLKNSASSVNKEVGKKMSQGVEAAEDVANAASNKTEELKRQASNKSEELKNSASNVNKELGKKASQGVEAAENMSNAASDKTEQLKRQASQTAENLKGKAPTEKSIIDTVKEGVAAAGNVIDKAANAVGLGAKKTEHRLNEAKDEAKVGAKKAANYADEAKDKAANEFNKKLN